MLILSLSLKEQRNMRVKLIVALTAIIWGLFATQAHAKNKWIIAAQPGVNGTIETLYNLEATYQVTIVSKNKEDSCAKFWLIETGVTTDLFGDKKVCDTAIINVGKGGGWKWLKSIGKTEVRYGSIEKPTLLFVSSEAKPSLSISFNTDWDGVYTPYSLTLSGQELRFHHFDLLYEAAKECGTSIVCWKKATENVKNKKPIDYKEPISDPIKDVQKDKVDDQDTNEDKAEDPDMIPN